MGEFLPLFLKFKMKNKISILFFLLLSFLTFSQNNCLAVVYEMTPKVFKDIDDSMRSLITMYPFVENTYKAALKDTVKLKYDLFVENNVSFFAYRKEPESGLDNNQIRLMQSLTKYTGTIYRYKDSTYIQAFNNKENLYVSKKRSAAWEIMNESKVISGYTCFKAITYDIVTYNDKVFKHAVIAWFCPQVPFKFGPLGYGDLPGLIFELNVRGAVYGIKSMVFDKCNLHDFSKFQKIKVISEQEYEQINDDGY